MNSVLKYLLKQLKIKNFNFLLKDEKHRGTHITNILTIFFSFSFFSTLITLNFFYPNIKF